MKKERVLPWLVELSRVNAVSLAKGRPGDLPNLIYELRQWLELEPDEPLNAEVSGLEQKHARLQAMINRVAELLGAIADRKCFHADYSGGSVILNAGRLGSEGGRALSYRDANLEDAVLRVALDDLYEDVEAALRIQRCEEPECLSVFLAERKNQKYCSHRCANKMASRAYRKTHSKERAERERARYERRVRGRTAASVKVARRPRARV
jgi:CGNR zinc finger